MNIYTLSAIAIYLLALLFIGLFGYRKSKKTIQGGTNFLVGGRSLNFWLTALAAHASDMSSWLFMGLPGAIYSQGLIQIWVAVGLCIFMYLNWKFIAPKLRIATEKYDSHTLCAFLSSRFNDNNGTIRTLTAVMSLIFFTIYLSAGLNGIGILFESAFNLSYFTGVIFGIAIVIIYTYFGGYITLAWTDLFQGMFLLFMIALVPLIALSNVGGINAIFIEATKQNISLSIFGDYSINSFINIAYIALGWGLGYFGIPQILTKFMGIKNPNEINKSMYVGMTWQVLALSFAVLVGLVGISFFNDGLVNNELIFIAMVKQLFSSFTAGIILCAVLAAAISTTASQMLILASVLTGDVYNYFFAPKASFNELQRFFRQSILVVALIAGAISLGRISTIFELVWYAWTGLGCSFGPIIVLSLYNNKITRTGAIAGILFGGIISGIWQPFLSKILSMPEVPGMIPGFFGSALVIYAVSYLYPASIRL